MVNLWPTYHNYFLIKLAICPEQRLKHPYRNLRDKLSRVGYCVGSFSPPLVITMSSCDAQSTKWDCEYCTYVNWPSSTRCTMCRGKKPLQFGEDIYRLRDESPPSILGSLASGPSQAHETRPKNSNGKWECNGCTYLNWPRALKCNECNTARPTCELNLHEHLKSLSISSEMANVTSPSASARTPQETMKEYKESENDLRDRRSLQKQQGRPADRACYF